MEKNNEYLFVYGSLRKGYGHAMYRFVEAHFIWISAARVKGVLHDAGEYPAAMPAEPPAFIAGELYRLKADSIADDVWQHLDDYEGLFPLPGEVPLFRREQTIVQTGNDFVNAWIYWYDLPADDLPVIASGDILQHRLKNSI